MPRITFNGIGWIVVTALVFLPRVSWAAVHLCVDIESDTENQTAFEKLVRSEVARHNSHVAVSEGCERTLTVELFTVNRSQFLTARVDREVPVRYRINRDTSLDDALKKAITQVLGSDPAHLTADITRYSKLQRASHSVLKKGHTLWRAELFEILGRGDGSLSFASGAAFAVTRGADHVRVLARLHLAGRPGKWAGRETSLRISSGLDLGVIYEVSELANTTFYVGGGLGIHYQRYEGTLDIGGAPSEEAINEVVPNAFFRMGVRFLRMYDFDLDLFVAGYVPFLKINDEDIPLFGTNGLYAPFSQIGIGVGF